MGFFNGMWELTKAFASGEAQRELGQIFREAGHDFITDVLLIDIDQKIFHDIFSEKRKNPFHKWKGFHLLQAKQFIKLFRSCRSGDNESKPLRSCVFRQQRR